VALFNVGRLSLEMGHLETAKEHLENSRAMFIGTGNQREAAFALNQLAVLACIQGQDEAAMHFADQCLAIRASLEDQRGVAETKRVKARILIARCELENALRLLQNSASTVSKIGDDRGAAETLEIFAVLMCAMKINSKMVVLYTAAEEVRKRLQWPLPPKELSVRQTNLDRARKLLGADIFNGCWERGRWMPSAEALSFGTDCQIAAQAV
jgi:tetratricopeptide (TPR) repeat protein